MMEQIQMDKTKRAFGMWDSQITPELIAAAIGVADPQWDTDGQTLVWREGRSGKGVLMAHPLWDAPYEISGQKNVSGGVGYGGGDFTIQGGLVIFAAKDGRLYRRPLGAGFPEPITPQYGSVASPKLSPGNDWVAFVHNYEGKDVIGLVDSQGENWPVKLAENSDFYMQPVWHPSGEAIAWVEWDHPNMPWDGTRLMYAALEGSPPEIQAVQQLAGGADIPILQPAFSRDGRYLTYVQNQGEWDQLILRDLQDGSLKTLVEGASILKPAWIQGVVVQVWSADNEHVYFVQTQAGVNTISKVNVKTGALEDIDMQPYTSLSQPSVSADERLAAVAGAPSISPRVVSKKGEKLTIHQRSTSESIPTGDLPTPYEISWTSSDG